MDGELWRQWQAFAAMITPGAAAMQSPFARPGAPSASDCAAAAERFYADAQRFLAASAEPGSAAALEAARAFVNALRERFAEFFPALRGVGLDAPMQASPAWPGAGLAALGPNREHQLRWQRMLEDWGRMSDAQQRLQRLWSDALREAAEAFAERALSAPLPPADVGGLHALYDQWIDCAEQAYARAAHDDAFSNALADYVNAASAWRRGLQESVEQWAKLLDLPTRSELNTLLQRLKSLEQRTPPAAAASPTRRASTARSKRAATPEKSGRRPPGKRGTRGKRKA
jgi:hypothetical protein